MTKLKLSKRKKYSLGYEDEGEVPENNNEEELKGGEELTPWDKSSSSNDEFTDGQFQKPVHVPVRSICLAGFLCFAGSLLLGFGFLVISGKLDEKFMDRIWPMVIMGLLMFIPGAYHVRIAYYAYKGIPGYSFDDIPEFE